MSVTSATIAVALGRTAPLEGSVDDLQWSMWVDDALLLIQARLGDLSLIDQPALDYVVREAVVAHVRRPDSATQVTTSVDDGSVSKTYRSGRGRLEILDEWWALLNPAATSGTGKAFEVDTMPASAGILGVDYWWVTPTDTAAL